MGHLSPYAAVVLVFVTGALMWFAARKDARHVLQQRFATAARFDGHFAECKVRFLTDETSTPCIVRLTPEGWYMVSPEQAVTKRHWASGAPLLKQPVLIPWTLLQYRRAKFPLYRWLRFDVPSAKVIFFVRQSVALDLLRAAGRPLPPP